jgi:uncharacterized membrane protein
MLVLILGLVIFLGSHSVRIVAEPWRQAQIARLGPKGWKAAYSVVSIIGFVLIIWGYGIARSSAIVGLWPQPVRAPHLAGLLTLIAFILFAASHGPVSHFKAWVHHPMVTGVGLWAFGHLLANGTLRGVVLFGAFLVWSIADYLAARHRDHAQNIVYPPASLKADIVPVVAGLVIWAVFAFWLHRVLIGVSPLV